MDGVSAFPRILSPLVSPCLTLSPLVAPCFPRSPHMCAVGWCVRLPEIHVPLCPPLSPTVSPHVWVSAAFYNSSVLMLWIWTTLGTELLGQIQAKLKVAAVSTCLYTCSRIWNIQVDVVTRAVMSDTMTSMLQRCKMHTWLFCYVWVFLQVAVVELVSASSLPCFN